MRLSLEQGVNLMIVYKDFHLYSGSGAGARGFKDAVSEYRGIVGKFR